MEGFNDFLTEKVDKKEMQKLHVVILGLGDEEGTFADIVQKLSKKHKHSLITYCTPVLLYLDDLRFIMSRTYCMKLDRSL